MQKVNGSRFVGCATSREYMVLTTALVSSLDQFGDVHDATLIVGDFGLHDEDRERLRASAGRLGHGMRFVAVDEDSPLIPARIPYPFPLPSLGRLVIPSVLEGRDARLVWLDSDMIVNRSLQPLFDLDMAGKPIAAVRDPLSPDEQRARGRALDENYFNAGLLVMDLGRFNGARIGQQAVERLASYPERPTFLDQDGLNDVIGADWVRLERRWNLFYAGDPRQFTYEEFVDAPITHFAGAKPTEAPDHPAYPLWTRQVERINASVHARRGMNAENPHVLLALAHEILLGREATPDMLRHVSAAELIGDVISSAAFRGEVVDPLRHGRSLAPRPGRGPTMGQRFYAAERLPLSADSAYHTCRAEEWRAFYGHLVRDPHFMALAGLAPFEPVPELPAG